MTKTTQSVKIKAVDVRKHFALRASKKRSEREAEPQTFVALEDINLEIKNGEFMVLVGPSGCGKTTFLHMLAGLSEISGGTIYIDEKPIDGPGLDRGVVFQQYALLPWKTALGNVEFTVQAKKIPRKEQTAIARQYLSLVGLDGFEDRYPHELSGGMCQRVAIARSLAYQPDVLLMDEPFAALDAQTRELLQDELLRIWAKTKKTIVFITHSIDEAVYLGQRVAVMTSKPGRIKKLTEIDLPDDRPDLDDLRSDPHFASIRHEIWASLHEEVLRTEYGSAGVKRHARPERGERASPERDIAGGI
ncbi:MAG: ABC transporter ATP-binding protein [Clostridiales Family XIII bacterium]|jgi:NitT/TauT family transport system ATP-binding protein|nr:ABC transporter ATP-binding protein [Clostridiales Family XIII bacterium]